MTNDLRARAERLLDIETGISYGSGTDYVDGGFAADDAVALARDYLAERPADDGEPVTEEWLAEVVGHPARPICGEWEWLIASVALKNDAETLWAFGKRKWVKMPFDKLTRGHVRRLLAALASITVAT